MQYNVQHSTFQRWYMPSSHSIIIHAIDKEFSCELCGELFALEWQLKSHLAHHKRRKKVKNLICQTCGRSFTDEVEMSAHVCKHYSCDMCDAKFLRERNLKFHKRVHEGATVYSCSECEALFESKKRLNSHKNTTHSDRKKWVCKNCPKAFKSCSGLKQHTLWHSGEKPFKCDTCDATFKTKTHLKSHQRIHTDEFSHRCDGCGMKFRELTGFKVHREKNSCGISDQDRYRSAQEGGRVGVGVDGVGREEADHTFLDQEKTGRGGGEGGEGYHHLQEGEEYRQDSRERVSAKSGFEYYLC